VALPGPRHAADGREGTGRGVVELGGSERRVVEVEFVPARDQHSSVEQAGRRVERPRRRQAARRRERAGDGVVDLCGAARRVLILAADDQDPAVVEDGRREPHAAVLGQRCGEREEAGRRIVSFRGAVRDEKNVAAVKWDRGVEEAREHDGTGVDEPAGRPRRRRRGEQDEQDDERQPSTQRERRRTSHRASLEQRDGLPPVSGRGCRCSDAAGSRPRATREPVCCDRKRPRLAESGYVGASAPMDCRSVAARCAHRLRSQAAGPPLTPLSSTMAASVERVPRASGGEAGRHLGPVGRPEA
jgi:hypothetical protein